MKIPIQKKLTLFLAGGLICIALGISGYLLFVHYLSVPIKVKDLAIDSNAALKLNVLKQISKKNGITEWELTAKSATLLKGEDKAILDEISVLFFTKDNKTIVMTAQKGVLNTKTHDMVFSGAVVIKYGAAELKTEQLQYNKKDHIIITDTHIRVEVRESFIKADKARINLNQDKILFEGNIKGEFYENIGHLL
jgi:LPS export ABC transporter protein LptC